MEIVNPHDVNFWDKLYKVSLAAVVPAMYVFAEYEAAAIDTYADYAEEQGWMGYFLEESEVREDYTDENGEEIDIVRVGNYSRPVFSGEVFCQEVKGKEKKQVVAEAKRIAGWD